MDSAGSTVPAWKRLGLKLRNQSQSGATLPALDESQTPKTQRETPSYALGPTIPTENGKPSKLGKRKHQVEPAEDQGQTIKRSKRDANGAKLHGITGDIAVAPAKEENGQANSVPETSASDGQRPKGDPNYRKKKKNGKRMDDTKQSPDESHFGNFSFGQSLREDADSPDQTDGPTLLVSTEIDFEASEPVATPLKQKPKGPLGKTAILATSSLSPPQTDRRKSVTFTPDTKTTDGNSAQNLFKKWVQEQKGVEAEFTQIEVAQFAPPPKSHPDNSLASLSAVSKDTEETQKPKPEKKKPTKEATANPDNSPSSAPKGKKKDPSLYIAYLKQYHTDREHWKFNKAKQNDLIDNALNIFRIPGEHDEALFEYIKGLKGAGVIERLKEKCKNTLQALDMDDPNDRNAAREEALKERVTKENKRRRLDGDLENLIDHPSSEGYIRRLKRARAERLLNALNMAAPAQPTSTFQTRLTQKVPRKRNLRTAASSDESSSDSSSSEESSSSESESESEDSEESKDESSSQSESESDSDSSSEASDSAGSSSSSSSSDSDSD